ncbi:hypothetical protein PV326_009004 [Microctonus aethiopoides]|nr:hypothetical protein PV326_009004 [Microctonus aethiopoides]
MDEDVVRICKETQQRYSVWERPHLFTGSTCYGLELSEKTVIETGLIVSKCNHWLAVSPDGVIFKDDVPVNVLEIKLGTAHSTENQPYCFRSVTSHKPTVGNAKL